ncbi:MAG: hypothetical protein MUC96_37190, partial [Myxococcaceae bacterium]|nr:hypothetical protein [Myxococcaceae bacterium]
MDTTGLLDIHRGARCIASGRRPCLSAGACVEPGFSSTLALRRRAAMDTTGLLDIHRGAHCIASGRRPCLSAGA